MPCQKLFTLKQFHFADVGVLPITITRKSIILSTLAFNVHFFYKGIVLEYLADFILFFAKAVVLIGGIGILISMAIGASSKGKSGSKGHLEVTPLNEHYDELKEGLQCALLDDQQLKQLEKEKKQQAKLDKKAKKKAQKTQAVEETIKPRIFVLDFDGDMKASAAATLREEITAILAIANIEQDEVVLRLESGGGMVHSYGLASSQLQRIRSKGLKLTITVDKVAASGGYMMACVADQIVAAPFAIIGSIGVMAQLPNFNRLLKKHDIDFELHTAGEYKRTLTMLGENTDKGREKFVQDIEETHQLFKNFVKQARPTLDIEQVATGEIWYGQQALDLQLVDAVSTSDEYIYNQIDRAEVVQVSYVVKKSLANKLGLVAESSVDNLLVRWWSRLQNKQFFS